MWIFTTFGFFSVVQKTGDTGFTVRARCQEDLENLCQRYLPKENLQIIEGEGTDYPYRIKVGKDTFSEVVKEITRDVEYSNFKSEVMAVQGLEREQVYASVWSTLLRLEHWFLPQ